MQKLEDRFIKEGRVESFHIGITGNAVFGADVNSPRQIGRATIQFLIHKVAPTPDGLRQNGGGRGKDPST